VSTAAATTSPPSTTSSPSKSEKLAIFHCLYLRGKSSSGAGRLLWLETSALRAPSSHSQARDSRSRGRGRPRSLARVAFPLRKPLPVSLCSCATPRRALEEHFMPFLRFATLRPACESAFTPLFAPSQPRAVPSKSISCRFCTLPCATLHEKVHFPIYLHFRDPAPCPRRAFHVVFALCHAPPCMRKCISPSICTFATPGRAIEEHFMPFLHFAMRHAA